MHGTNQLLKVDLNLLLALDLLLEERSVTRAAKRLGRSQPATSHALARLRELLGDPLLVRQGRELVPTPRALALQGPLHHILGELGRVLEDSSSFDPATSTRRFVLACPDMLAPTVPLLLGAMAEAPGVRLELVPRRGLGALSEADVLVDGMPSDAPGVLAAKLGVLRPAVLMRKDHPALSDWGMESWLAAPHVLVRTGNGSPSLVDQVLKKQGRTRTVGLVLPELLLVPHVVSQSELMFTGPSAVFRPLLGPLGLVLMPPPIALPAVQAAALWQERLKQDAGHKWFRDKVVEVLRVALAEPA